MLIALRTWIFHIFSPQDSQKNSTEERLSYGVPREFLGFWQSFTFKGQFSLKTYLRKNLPWSPPTLLLLQKKKKKEIETKPIEFARKRVKEREKRRSIERRVNFSLRTHREPREGGVGVAAPRWEAVVESKAEDRTFTGKFRAFLCAAPRVPKFSAPAANCCLDRYRVYDKPPRAPIGAGRN